MRSPTAPCRKTPPVLGWTAGLAAADAGAETCTEAAGDATPLVAATLAVEGFAAALLGAALLAAAEGLAASWAPPQAASSNVPAPASSALSAVRRDNPPPAVL